MPDSPMYQKEAYLHCSYQLEDSVVIESESGKETENNGSDPYATSENTPKSYINNAGLIALVDVLDIQPIGHGEGWIYKVRILNDCIFSKKSANTIPEIVYIYQPNLFHTLKTFTSSEMIIKFQWPELMLWVGRKYIIFGNQVDNGLLGTDYMKNKTFQLNTYSINLPFHVIPVTDNPDYTIKTIFLKNNETIINIEPLIMKVELKPIKDSGGALTYNLTQLYKYDEISKYNYFCKDLDVLNQYQQWCFDILDEIRNSVES